MTSDPNPDADSAVKPQVIDLDAVDVTGDEPPKESAGGEPPRQPTPDDIPRRARRAWGWPLAALIAGAVIGGWLYRDLLSSYLPTSAMTAMANRIGALEVSNRSLVDTMSALKQANDKRNADLDNALGDAVTAASDAKAAVQKIEPRLAGLEKGLAAGKADLDKLRASLGSLPAGSGGAPDAAALAAITQRLDALEKDVAALKTGGGTAENAAMISALRQALSDVQAKIASGMPYRADYDRIVQMVPAAANDLLASYADNGLANATGLAAELRTTAANLPKPEAAAASTGYIANFWQALTSIVTVRDVGDVDWQGLCDTAAKLAESGKLNEAVAALDGAQAALPEAIARWRDRAVARVKLEAASADFAKAVALTLAAKGGGN